MAKTSILHLQILQCNISLRCRIDHSYSSRRINSRSSSLFLHHRSQHHLTHTQLLISFSNPNPNHILSLRTPAQGNNSLSLFSQKAFTCSPCFANRLSMNLSRSRDKERCRARSCWLQAVFRWTDCFLAMEKALDSPDPKVDFLVRSIVAKLLSKLPSPEALVRISSSTITVDHVLTFRAEKNRD